MKTVKTWKIDRTNRTAEWLEKVAYPTIEKLMGKGKTKVTFTGLSANLDIDFAINEIRGFYLNPKYNEEENSLSVNWYAPELDFEAVYNVLAH